MYFCHNSLPLQQPRRNKQMTSGRVKALLLEVPSNLACRKKTPFLKICLLWLFCCLKGLADSEYPCSMHMNWLKDLNSKCLLLLAFLTPGISDPELLMLRKGTSFVGQPRVQVKVYNFCFSADSSWAVHWLFIEACSQCWDYRKHKCA